jgi:hypothetical protein
MNKIYAIGILMIVVIGIGYSALVWDAGDSDIPANSSCEYNQLNYYFRKTCSHCQRVLKDRSLEKLEDLGVRITKFEVVNWGMYGIYATPTFELGGRRYEGYRTFEQLKELLGCKRNI